MKVLFVATVVQKHIMEFHIPYLKMFKEHGWETAVAARNDYDDPDDCRIPFCDHYYDIPFERSPFRADNIRAYKELKKVINEGDFDIIHCHTPVGGVLTRIAAQSARKKGTKVFYTAHGFHFYTGAPIKNWLIYYPIEKWLAHKTDVLVTINQEDYRRAKNFKAGKVVYIPGVGIDLRKFENKPYIRYKKRHELGFSENDMLLLSVGELIERKKHRIVLEAIGKLKDDPVYGHLHYLICGSGILEDKLKDLASELGILNHVHFLGYRNDIPDICNAADLFVHMSDQEELPVALMEAMACGLPVVCSAGSINTDLIENGKNGILAEKNPLDLSKKIKEMAMNPDLRKKLGYAAIQTVKHYDFSLKADEFRKGCNLTEKNDDSTFNRLLEAQNIRRKFNIPDHAVIFLSVGEVNRNKNHELAMKAISKIQNKDLYYVIVGNGNLIEEEKKVAEKLGINVIFTGYQKNVKMFYRMADVFVFPSLREGLPVSMLEAMACGLPCVASRIRGNEDLLKESRLLFKNNDMNDLIEKLKLALNPDIQRKEIERNDKVIKQYSIENTTKSMWRLYENC